MPTFQDCKNALGNCFPGIKLLSPTLQPRIELAQNGAADHCKRVCFFFDKPEIKASCCSDRLVASNASYPLETCAYRQLGARIAEKLRNMIPEGVAFTEYTLEVDLVREAPLPRFDLLILLTHDWPTVHEDPAWAFAWLNIVARSKAVVPTSEQILWLFEKTRYISDIQDTFRGESNPIMLPTLVVRKSDSIEAVARWADKLSPTKIVTKENFSAGKEGVQFLATGSIPVAAKKLEAVRREAGVQQPRSKCSRGCLRQRFWDEEMNEDAFDRIDTMFKGGNKHVFMVQQYEGRFKTLPEKRLYFCHGKFLYAMGYRGWIDINSVPTETNVERELEQSRRLIENLPRLKRYPLVRLDFGPDGLLSEIEVLPDLFGGPDGNLKGDRWKGILNDVADAFVEDGLDSLRNSYPSVATSASVIPKVNVGQAKINNPLL